jgi:predicted transcriptional regulator
MPIKLFTVQLFLNVIVHKLNIKLYCKIIMENNQDNLNILRKIQNKSDITQQDLANRLGFNLGKLIFFNKNNSKLKDFFKSRGF